MCRKAFIAVALSLLVVTGQTGCGGGGSSPSAGSSVVSGSDTASSTDPSSGVTGSVADPTAGTGSGAGAGVGPGAGAGAGVGAGTVAGAGSVGSVVPGGTSGIGVAKLSWPTVEGATGFKVYIGTVSKTYSSTVNVGMVPSYSVSGLAPGTYYFAVTAYDAMGNESVYSNEVSKTVS